MEDWTRHFATRASRMAASEIRELLKLLDQPDIISFAGGIPDPVLFPQAEIARAYAAVLGDPERSSAALQYSVSEGFAPLREWLADYMTGLGAPCAPGNILITNGSQQGLDFIGKLFISPGDTVLVSWPTYLGALQAFNSYEPRFDVLPAADNNRTVESYRVDGRGGPKFGYVMPEFQNPTGASLSQAERERLLDQAEALDMPLVEDSAYETLRYDGDRIPSLLAMDIARSGGVDNGRVIYLGTFSKSIVPALRVGWIVAPRQVIDKLVLVKQASDLHVSTLNQMVMHQLAAAILKDHTAGIRDVYRRRRDATLAALSMHMPAGVTWTPPEGGMFIWLRLPEAIDGAALLERCILEARVAFVPGSAFHADRSGRNTIRLSFSLNDEAKASEGIARIAAMIRKMLAAG
jgi:DNA-binding transcriptional MocR family regulator